MIKGLGLRYALSSLQTKNLYTAAIRSRPPTTTSSRSNQLIKGFAASVLNRIKSREYIVTRALITILENLLSLHGDVSFTFSILSPLIIFVKDPLAYLFSRISIASRHKLLSKSSSFIFAHVFFTHSSYKLILVPRKSSVEIFI